MQVTRSSLVLTLLCFGAVSSANAEINGFSLNKITADNISGSLSDRIGPNSSDSEHVINLSDCNAYLGGTMTVVIDVDPLGKTNTVDTWHYTTAYTHFGGTCAESPPTASESCEVVEQDKELNDVGQITVLVELDKFLQTCAEGDDVQGTIVVYLEGQDVADEEQSDTITFELDFTRPEAPTNLSLDSGDERLVVNWDESVSSDVEQYTVYWSSESFDSSDYDTMTLSDTSSSDALTIEDGLENGTTYYVAVLALDDNDNPSALAGPVSAAPVPLTDFWERYRDIGGPDEGGYCFVATATFGTAMARDLNALRDFRDGVLMQSWLGRQFVDFYYRWGRYPAAWLADKPVARAFTRVFLVPLVWLAKLFVSYHWLVALGLLVMLCFLGRAVHRGLSGWILRELPLEAR